MSECWLVTGRLIKCNVTLSAASQREGEGAGAASASNLPSVAQ